VSAAFYTNTSAHISSSARPASQNANPGEPAPLGGTVNLVLNDGNRISLHQTLSADGARYANADESFVFLSKGPDATILENGRQGEYYGCKDSRVSKD